MGVRQRWHVWVDQAKGAGGEPGAELALYGRGDHLDFDAALSLHDRQACLQRPRSSRGHRALPRKRLACSCMQQRRPARGGMQLSGDFTHVPRRWEMGVRAAYLISIFLPFLLLGPLLFLMCRLLDAWAARAAPQTNGAAAGTGMCAACCRPQHGPYAVEKQKLRERDLHVLVGSHPHELSWRWPQIYSKPMLNTDARWPACEAG